LRRNGECGEIHVGKPSAARESFEPTCRVLSNIFKNLSEAPALASPLPVFAKANERGKGGGSRGQEGDCFGDRAARLAGRTTPPNDLDERNERIRFLGIVGSSHDGVNFHSVMRPAAQMAPILSVVF
jgi:hypothetical protein